MSSYFSGTLPNSYYTVVEMSWIVLWRWWKCIYMFCGTLTAACAIKADTPTQIHSTHTHTHTYSLNTHTHTHTHTHTLTLTQHTHIPIFTHPTSHAHTASSSTDHCWLLSVSGVETSSSLWTCLCAWRAPRLTNRGGARVRIGCCYWSILTAKGVVIRHSYQFWDVWSHIFPVPMSGICWRVSQSRKKISSFDSFSSHVCLSFTAVFRQQEVLLVLRRRLPHLLHVSPTTKHQQQGRFQHCSIRTPAARLRNHIPSPLGWGTDINTPAEMIGSWEGPFNRSLR